MGAGPRRRSILRVVARLERQGAEVLQKARGAVDTFSAPVRDTLGQANVRAGRRLAKNIQAPQVAAYCIWRNANADLVLEMISQLPVGAKVHLHCLDREPDLRLAKQTGTVGRGFRMRLMQKLIADHPAGPDSWILIFDDDVRFRYGNPLDFLRLAKCGGLDLAQPAHTWTSHATYRMTRSRVLSIARRTHFIEVGPVVLISPSAQRYVLPFPEHFQMGWGLDIEWVRLARDGKARLGVVDATPVDHVGSIGAEYGQADESSLLKRYLREEGVTSTQSLARETGEVWRPWVSRAPWVRGIDGGC